MAEHNGIQQMLDRAAITDVVHAYATAVDRRDWDLFRSLFKDRLFLDFRSFHPNLYRDMPVDELVGISRKLEAFDSTQHLMANHSFEIGEERATCIAYTQAGHFLKRDGEDHVCFLFGYYTFEMERSGQGWQVDRYGLTVTAQQGDSRVFEWAGLL